MIAPVLPTPGRLAPLSLAAVPLALCTLAFAQLPPVPETTAGDTRPEPHLFVAQRLIDLGTVLEGDKPIVSWRLENRGGLNLVIERTRPSCGCTVVRLEEEDRVLHPGESLELRAEFNSAGRTGVQNKKITIYTNDPAEPALEVQFRAHVESLYEITPPGLVNLRAMRRGEMAETGIEILPGPGRRAVEILSVKPSKRTPLKITDEPFERRGRAGRRVRFRLDKDAPLGAISTTLALTLNIDGVTRERTVPVRGQAVGELDWRPAILDQTRLASRPGKRFAPITIRSTNKKSFELRSADAGGALDVSIKPGRRDRTRYTVVVAVRKDARPGPLAAMLTLRTNLPDQPLIQIPVFAVIAAPIEVEPPMVLLRDDGTAEGTNRRLCLRASAETRLDIVSVTTDNTAVVATVETPDGDRPGNLVCLSVRLVSQSSGDGRSGVLTIATNVEGASRLEVPFEIGISAEGG